MLLCSGKDKKQGQQLPLSIYIKSPRIPLSRVTSPDNLDNITQLLLI